MMAAQTLEPVPEEAVAPPTPERVTSDAPKETKPATAKNPGRVASGKRLAERNRLAREAKKQAEAQKPTTSTTDNTNTTNTSTEQSSNNNTYTGYFILGIGGLIVSGLGVYYQREAIMRTLGRSQKPQTKQPAPVESNNIVEEPKRKGRIREMEQFLKSYMYTMDTNTVLRFMGFDLYVA